MMDCTLYNGRVAQSVSQHHVLKGNGLVVHQNSRAKRVERVQIADFASAVLHHQTPLNVKLLRRSSDGNLTQAEALHSRHHTCQQGTEHIELQGVKFNSEIKAVVFFRRVIGTVNVQRFPQIVEHACLNTNGLVVVVPIALNVNIANLVAIQGKALHIKVGQQHWAFLQAAQQGIARNEAVDVYTILHKQDIEVGEVELPHHQRKRILLFHRHKAIKPDEL